MRFNIIAEMLFINSGLVFIFIPIFKSNCAAQRRTQYHNVHPGATLLPTRKDPSIIHKITKMTLTEVYLLDRDGVCDMLDLQRFDDSERCVGMLAQH
jgi:hypothetical protein